MFLLEYLHFEHPNSILYLYSLLFSYSILSSIAGTLFLISPEFQLFDHMYIYGGKEVAIYHKKIQYEGALLP